MNFTFHFDSLPFSRQEKSVEIQPFGETLLFSRHSILWIFIFLISPQRFLFRDDKPFYLLFWIISWREKMFPWLSEIKFYHKTLGLLTVPREKEWWYKLNCLLSNESTLIFFIVSAAFLARNKAHIWSKPLSLDNVYPPKQKHLVMINTQTCPELRWQQCTTTLRRNFFFNTLGEGYSGFDFRGLFVLC